MEGGLKQESDGRFSRRLDPAFLTPGPPERLKGAHELVAARFAKVTCPVLLLSGAESWMPAPMERMAKLNPRARTVTVPRADHWVTLDNPRGFVEAVMGFLTEGL
jgi:pimeloyl-ACP methyl ester carboxylesterase